MNTPYEILLRFDDAGVYRGGHTVRRNSDTGRVGSPEPIGTDTDFPWPDVAAEVNTASLASVTALQEQISTLESQLAALQTGGAGEEGGGE